MIGQRKPRGEAPYKWFKPPRGQDSLWAHLCVYPHINTCFTTFPLYVEIYFYTVDGPGPCHWPLVPCGLVAKIQCSHYPTWLWSLAGNQSPAEAAAGQGHPRSDWWALVPSLCESVESWLRAQGSLAPGQLSTTFFKGILLPLAMRKPPALHCLYRDLEEMPSSQQRLVIG